MEREIASEQGRRVGDLAAATGTTVRALHYYEEIGLLVPSGRTEAGHRLYGDADIERLYRINLLRRLNLSLAEIAHALDDPAWDLRASLNAHVSELEQRLETERRLQGRLRRLLASLDSNKKEMTESLLTVLEDMTMLDSNVQTRMATLVYADLAAGYEHLERVFGLGPGRLTRDDEDRPVHGEMQVGDGVIWLHPEAPEFQMASPQSLGGTSASVSVLVDDVDQHFEHARTEGAQILYEPADQPYGYREYSARDPEGHLWSFMKPLD